MSAVAMGGVQVETVRFGEAAPLVSVLTVSNRPDVVERNLAPSLRRQIGVPFEWIIAHNEDDTFASAPAALNAVARHALGETLVFVHQDVVLYGDTWLSTLHERMLALTDVGVAGVIGRAEDGRFIGFLRDRRAISGTPLADPIEVQTLDECVLAMPRRVFEREPFDMSLGGWHVYGVDACLRARRSGLRAYVLPLFVHHDSSSTNVAGLGAAHEWIHRRHGQFESPIHTTCGTIDDAKTTRRAVARAYVGRAVRRVARAAGLQLRTGHHALLEEIEERYNDILVLHFVRHVPAAVPRRAEAEALSPESRTHRRVRHLVLSHADAPEAALHGSGGGAELILLTSPAAAPVGQLVALREALRGSSADVAALPNAPDDRAAEILRAAGWRLRSLRSAPRGRAGAGMITLDTGRSQTE